MCVGVKRRKNRARSNGEEGKESLPPLRDAGTIVPPFRRARLVQLRAGTSDMFQILVLASFGGACSVDRVTY